MMELMIRTSLKTKGMIGTVSSDEKAAVAKQNGCTHTVVTTRENIAERVREITGGKGVPVVYDSVGKSTFQGSLDCLRTFGLMVNFGNASGSVGRAATGFARARPSARPWAGEQLPQPTGTFRPTGPRRR